MNRWRVGFSWLLGFACWVTGAWSGIAQAQGMLEGASSAVSAAPLPIVFEQLRIEVDEQHASIVLEQHFKNPTGERLEGRYLFRMGEGARVHGLRYWNGEQEIVGEVFERQVATEVYQEVTGIGRDPALFEQVGEGTFSFRIFPIEANETKRVEVRYDFSLVAHGNEVELHVPVSGPRTQARVSLRDPRGVTDASSPSHMFRVMKESSHESELVVEGPKGEPQAFVLRYRVNAAPLELRAALHRDQGHDAYLMLHLASPARVPKDDVQPKDVTIVIDHSGSMSGEPLTHACSAARQIVASMAARDRVNLVVFDDHAEAMYQEPRELSDEVRKEVTRRIDHLASGGGTDIALALKTALSAQNQDAYPNVVLFMTDGQSDPKAALAEAQADAHDTRVFTIGLGAGVEKPLLSRLAVGKRGRFVFIPDVASIEPEVAHLYKQISAPLVTDLELEAEGAQIVEVYPRTLSDLFVDDELRVYARVLSEEHQAKPLFVHLKGKLRGREVRYDTRVDVPPKVSRPWVGSRWAKARVDDLLEEIALHGETDELKDEVIELALSYNFITPYTSFLAIPASEMTDFADERLTAAREAKRRIREAHPDAAALSRSEMPPGDPIISVLAPQSARQVTASFPFGLTLDLTWDSLTERWMSRFLVPKDVPDGLYTVEVFIVRADGAIEHTQVRYTIDATAEEPLIDVRAAPGGLVLRVLTEHEPREVRAVLRDAPLARALLTPGTQEGCAYGFLAAEPGIHRVRVVVSDAARNEHVSEHTVEVSAEERGLSFDVGEVCP